MVKDSFQKLSGSYIERFDLVPEFKAGFHCGKVITGEIGVIGLFGSHFWFHSVWRII
jgi:hypothetical protein